MERRSTRTFKPQRRAAAAIMVLATLPVLLGFAALTIDIGILYGTRADLQNAADAAALSGAQALVRDAMTAVRMKTEGSSLRSVYYEVAEEIKRVARLNHSFGTAQTAVAAEDVVLGWIDLTRGDTPIQTNLAANLTNGVQVTVRRSRDSVNSPVALMFAPIFGRNFADVSASAVAALDDRFSGFETAGYGGILPITMDSNEYEYQKVNGGDDYTYDTGTDSIGSGGDGHREVIAYPDKLAPGNFGLLNIGVPNLGTTEIAEQIENGVSASDFETETGSSELKFYDDDGKQESYTITGNSGLKADLQDAFATRVGQVIGFFIHDHVDNGGANAEYRVTGMRFARVMDVKLKTSDSTRGLWLQPVTMMDPAVQTNAFAPSSGGAAGRLILAR